MMTPKQKAEELYTHMFECVINPEITQLEMETMAISSALISVDEILNLSKIASLRRDEVYMELEYWLEVKKEIENL
jgi:hypothetical protein